MDSSQYSQYIADAMSGAKFKTVEDEDIIIGEIPGFPGVWSYGESEAEARDELREDLKSWIEVRLSHGMDIPGAGKTSES